ncbi:MAG: AMP-binding protein [Acidimicrobiia bacterium]|nr:AMP-binding protein [Acidimicrobiia bacterium]
MSLAPYPVHPVTDDLITAATRHPDKVALIDGISGAQYTFAEILTAARRVGRHLQDFGVGVGDRVGIVATNSPEWAVVFLGTLFAGGTVTTLNPLYTEREIAEQFADSTPKAVFAVEATAPNVRAVWGDAAGLHLTDDVWDLAASAAGEVVPVVFDPMTHLAVLPYSSGTTGAPKGVMLTHHNLTSNVRQTLGSGLIDGYSVMVDFLPFFHIYGMAVLLLPGLAAGATQITMPAFDLARFLEIIEEHRATMLMMVPPALLALANSAAEADLSSVKYINSGAAPLPLDVARRVTERYGVTVVQGYGMTEASPVTHISLLGRLKEGTVGPPVADTRQKVVDLDTGATLPIGEVGELLVSGPQVMQGYYGRDDATEESIVEDAEGRWLRTGDIVTMDADGYVTIHDRAKEMIKYKGYQIAPAELESVIMEHPDVLDVAVIPKDTGTADGEYPKAFVVRKPDTTLDADAVMAHVTATVAPYKKVREVEFVDAIPKNPSGKILRRELKAQERARS